MLIYEDTHNEVKVILGSYTRDRLSNKTMTRSWYWQDITSKLYATLPETKFSAPFATLTNLAVFTEQNSKDTYTETALIAIYDDSTKSFQTC